MRKVRVAGVGMIPFTKPGASEHYTVMGEKAIRLAVQDAGIDFTDIEQAFAGYVYGDSTCGQAVIYRVGLTGIPIVNVNNNCSTGSSALFLAQQLVASGLVECALAVGFEEMRPGALGSVFSDRPSPMERQNLLRDELQDFDPQAPSAAQSFGGAGREHQEKYGTKDQTFAKISVKARRHAANNPMAIFRAPITLDDVMNAPHIYGPLTRLQCCPPTCGAAAAIVCSDEFAMRKGIHAPVEIKGQAMTTDYASTFDDRSLMKVIGFDMTRQAALKAYEMAGVGPEDIQVVELHDCFSANELLTYEALGLCPEGGAEKFIEDGDNTYGGKFVTNPSGGLLSKGHPLGATGLAQCAEMVWQLRGQAEKRQVEGARHALQHNLGLGGACVVTLYGLA